MPNNDPGLAAGRNPTVGSVPQGYASIHGHIKQADVGRRQSRPPARPPASIRSAKEIEEEEGGGRPREINYSTAAPLLATGSSQQLLAPIQIPRRPPARRRRRPAAGGGGDGGGKGVPAAPDGRRREDEGRGGGDGAAEAELVVARHRAGRGVGAAAARDTGQGPPLAAAARAERHGRPARRAARLPRSGLPVRPALAALRRLRRREEPPRRDAPGARPPLRRQRQRQRQRRRRRGLRGQPVLLRRLLGGLRAVADREPPLHTLSR